MDMYGQSHIPQSTHTILEENRRLPSWKVKGGELYHGNSGYTMGNQRGCMEKLSFGKANGEEWCMEKRVGGEFPKS